MSRSRLTTARIDAMITAARREGATRVEIAGIGVVEFGKPLTEGGEARDASVAMERLRRKADGNG